MVGWGRKSHLGPAEIASFSSLDFSRSNKHDTCCIGWIFLRFVFMNHCCVRFSLLENYKKAFPCLLPAATQVIISTNIFIYLKYYTA